MIVLDANVLIAHFGPGDVHHAAATRLLLEAGRDTALVHALTLAEVLVGGVRTGRGRDLRDDLVAMGVRVAGRDDDEPLRLAELRVSTGLKLPDCCVLDVALRRPASLATFDSALADAARSRGIAVVPRGAST